MNLNKENDILETTLSIAERRYLEAYQFLRNTYGNTAQTSKSTQNNKFPNKNCG